MVDTCLYHTLRTTCRGLLQLCICACPLWWMSFQNNYTVIDWSIDENSSQNVTELSPNILLYEPGVQGASGYKCLCSYHTLPNYAQRKLCPLFVELGSYPSYVIDSTEISTYTSSRCMMVIELSQSEPKWVYACIAQMAAVQKWVPHWVPLQSMTDL